MFAAEAPDFGQTLKGHERSDVVAHRQEFTSYFLQNKNQYYTVTDDDQPKWMVPAQNPPVLICKFHIFPQHSTQNNEFLLRFTSRRINV